jgi:hypothetical protein
MHFPAPAFYHVIQIEAPLYRLVATELFRLAEAWAALLQHHGRALLRMMRRADERCFHGGYTGTEP